MLLGVLFVKMAEKRKGKKRKEEFCNGKDEPEKPAKEEYAVAKWLRKNVPSKKTKFSNHVVEYFTAVKAVNVLMTSQWAQAKEGEKPFSAGRADVVEFSDITLRHKFFHRAKKVTVTEAELEAKLKKKEERRRQMEGKRSRRRRKQSRAALRRWKQKKKKGSVSEEPKSQPEHEPKPKPLSHQQFPQQ